MILLNVGVGVLDDPSANLFAACAARAVGDASPYDLKYEGVERFQLA